MLLCSVSPTISFLIDSDAISSAKSACLGINSQLLPLILRRYHQLRPGHEVSFHDGADLTHDKAWLGLQRK